jgi:hypothetical protein
MMALIVPIVLSAVLVFIASALIWMVMPHHKTDFKTLPNEDAVRAALKNAAPGQYRFPWGTGGWPPDDATKRKLEEGPVGQVTLVKAGMRGMGPQMVQSFLFYLVVSFVIAYLSSRTVPRGTEYIYVFRAVGTMAWMAYGFGVVSDSIWFGRPWSSTIKHLADSLVFALMTAGTFAWRWPS